jgi:hypothetical protein
MIIKTMSTSSSSTDDGSIFNHRHRRKQSRISSAHSPRQPRQKIILNREQYQKVMQFLSRDIQPPRDNVVVNLTQQEIQYIQWILEADD